MACPQAGREHGDQGLLMAAGVFAFLMALLVGVFVLDDATGAALGGSGSADAAAGVVPGRAVPEFAGSSGTAMIEVREDDTLRVLAERFTSAGEDPGVLVRRIIELNDLGHGDLGHGDLGHGGVVAGDVLRVPTEN